MPSAISDGTFRFGVFQLDRRSGELRKHGLRIKLQDQPVQMLMLLLERAGETVSREEIRLRLWPENTFVDFDSAISSAVRKVREALSDSSDNPRFVETVARQGYRFVCPVCKSEEAVAGTIIATTEEVSSYRRPSEAEHPARTSNAVTLSPASSGPTAPAHEPDDDRNGGSPPRGEAMTPKRRMGWAPLAAMILLGLSAAWWVGRREGSSTDGNPLSNATFARLTDFPGNKSDASISPDGKFVAFRADWNGRSDVWVSQVGTGKPLNLTSQRPEDPLLPVQNLGFSFDGSEIWLAGYQGYQPTQHLRLMPLMGGIPRAFLRDHAVNVAWSADGKRLVFHTYDPGDPMFVADGNGANAR